MPGDQGDVLSVNERGSALRQSRGWVAAGLAGIKNGYELQAPSDLDDSDPKNSNYPQRNDLDRLPDNLSEALKFTENSELVKNALGKHVLESFIQNKKIEWEQYKTQVTNYEIEKYLPRL